MIFLLNQLQVFSPGTKTMIESKELHQKLVATSTDELGIFIPNDNASVVSGNSAQ
jgi:hypothetical protein